MVGMTPLGPRHVRALLVVALLACLVSIVSAQSYLEAFRTGLAALDQRRWADAARLMQMAARDRPDTGETVRLYGAIARESYLPQYFLGLALYQLGDYQGAIESFNAAEQRGFVKANAAYYRRMQDLRRDSQGKVPVAVAAATTSAPPTTTTIPVAQPPATTVKPPAITVAPTTTSTPAPQPVPAEAIRSAELAVQRAEEQRAAYDRVLSGGSLTEFDSKLKAVDQTARATFHTADQKLDSGRRGSADDLREATTLAQSATDGFLQARQLANDVMQRLKNELVSATTPYFAGNYAAAKTALSRLNYPDGDPGARFSTQMRLFLAAASYAQYVVGGQRDLTLLKEAEANVRGCRRLASPGFQPDPRAFSPRFIRFFNSISPGA